MSHDIKVIAVNEAVNLIPESITFGKDFAIFVTMVGYNDDF